jgi:hypothetical protein
MRLRVLAALRAALEALAAAAPQWLTGQIDAAIVKRYGARIDEWRLPKGQAGRQNFAVQTGHDGYRLLKATADRRAPAWLREIPAVEVLRQVWIKQYTFSKSGRAVIWRDAEQHGLPQGAAAVFAASHPATTPAVGGGYTTRHYAAGQRALLDQRLRSTFAPDLI